MKRPLKIDRSLSSQTVISEDALKNHCGGCSCFYCWEKNRAGDLEFQINQLRYSFNSETGKVATRLYLGRKTYRKMMDNLDPYLTHHNIDGHRAQFLGLYIYQVDAADHLGIG